jgi:myo-inositol-1(or 4)-monophosphatase
LAAGNHSRETLVRDSGLLKETVREAGSLALSLFGTELKNWTKGASSPVSEADIAVNRLLEKRLRAAAPEYGWLSEESADDEQRLERRRVWIVDPIDGTRG